MIDWCWFGWWKSWISIALLGLVCHPNSKCVVQTNFKEPMVSLSATLVSESGYTISNMSSFKENNTYYITFWIPENANKGSYDMEVWYWTDEDDESYIMRSNIVAVQ